MHSVSSSRALVGTLLFGLVKDVSAADSDDLALIIGCTVGGFVVLVLFVLLVCLVFRAKKEKESTERQVIYNGYVSSNERNSHLNHKKSNHKHFSPEGSGSGDPPHLTGSMLSTTGLPHGVWANNPSMMAPAPSQAYLMSRPDKNEKPGYYSLQNGAHHKHYEQRRPEQNGRNKHLSSKPPGQQKPEETWYNRTMRAMKNFPSIFQVKRNTKKTLGPADAKKQKSKPDKENLQDHLPRTTEAKSKHAPTSAKERQNSSEKGPAEPHPGESPTTAVAFNYFFGQDDIPSVEPEPAEGVARAFSDYPHLDDIPEDEVRPSRKEEAPTRQKTRDPPRDQRRKEALHQHHHKVDVPSSNLSQSDFLMNRSRHAEVTRSNSNLSKRSLPVGPTQAFPYGVPGFHTKQPSLFVAGGGQYSRGVVMQSNSFDRAQAKAKKDKQVRSPRPGPSSLLSSSGVGFAPDGSLIRPDQNSKSVFMATSESHHHHHRKPGQAQLSRQKSPLGMARRPEPEPDYSTKIPPQTRPKPKKSQPQHAEQSQFSHSQPNVFFKTKTAAEFRNENNQEQSYAVPNKVKSTSNLSQDSKARPPSKENFSHQIPPSNYSQRPEKFQHNLPTSHQIPIEIWPMPTLEKRAPVQQPVPVSQVPVTSVMSGPAPAAAEQPISWQEVPGRSRPASRVDGTDAVVHVADEAFKFLENYENEMSFDED